MSTRLPFLVAAIVAWAMPSAAQPTRGTPTTPNIVLIVADDLGYGDLSIYGHRTLKTPALDTLAREGLRFTDFYAAAALCSPSRAAMMTGRAPYRTGIESWIPPHTPTQLQRGEATIATLLRQRGYQTFLSGKWHLNGGLDQRAHLQPNDHGFDRYLALHAWAIPHHENPSNFYRDGVPVGEIKGFAAQIVVDEAIGYIEARRTDAPFFLYLSFAEPHGTIASPAVFNAQYAAHTAGRPDPMVNHDVVPHNLGVRGPGEYYANVAHMDHQIGRLLARLGQLGLRDDTVIVFTSDNGPVTRDWRQWYELNLYGSAGEFRGRKNDLYEGGIRVPAIVRWPGRVAAGRVTDAQASGYDLLPTLARIGGAALPADRAIDGEDLGPVLRGEPFRRARPLFWEFDDFNGFAYAIRDGRWKLIADRALTKVQLYDLDTDPWEVVNRATTSPEVVTRLLDQVRARHDEIVNDPLRPKLR